MPDVQITLIGDTNEHRSSALGISDDGKAFVRNHLSYFCTPDAPLAIGLGAKEVEDTMARAKAKGLSVDVERSGTAPPMRPVNLFINYEKMATLSTRHLSSPTRTKLANGSLSVLSYPNEHGGLIYVGEAGESEPDEHDLKFLVDASRLERVAWLRFDSDTYLLPGLPVFED